jgi:glycosyltransferase involved in cell wall biosynthesis
MNPRRPVVSIVIPVKNEERILDRCFDAIDKLDYPKDCVQVVIADGLSTDRSREIAERRGAKVISNLKQTVVSGRNCGFQVARGEYIAFTDADCVVRRDWLHRALEAFSTDTLISGVGGVSRFPQSATSFEEAVNLLFSAAELAGSTAQIQSIESTKYVDDIPGCNAIYCRKALAQVMPVDEQLLTAEDVWLNHLLRQRGYRLVFSEEMVLWHHRRSNPKRFYRQIYRFAIGRLQVGRRNRGLLNAYHILTAMSLPVMVVLGVGAVLTGHEVAALIGLFIAIAMTAGVALLKKSSMRGAIWFPPVLMIFATAWSLGFLRELVFPLKVADGK